MDITIQELHPFMLTHAHKGGMQLKPKVVALHKQNTLLLEPERSIKVS